MADYFCPLCGMGMEKTLFKSKRGFLLRCLNSSHPRVRAYVDAVDAPRGPEVAAQSRVKEVLERVKRLGVKGDT